MRPMLDDLELPLVQEISTFDRRMLAEHKPPGMDGSVIQNLGRNPACILLWGVAAGDTAREFLDKLDTKFKAGTPVPFAADIVSDAKIEKVLIDNVRLQELAGKPDRFAYVVTLRQHQVPKEPENVSAIDTSLLEDAIGSIQGLVNGFDAGLAFASGLARFIPQLGGLLGRLTEAQQRLGNGG